MKNAREARGLSQELLAELADIHWSYVSQLERGIKSPSLGVLFRITKALDLPASELIRSVEDAL